MSASVLNPRSAIGALLLGAGSLIAANGLVGTALGLTIRQRGFGDTAAAGVVAGFFAGLLVGAHFAGRVVEAAGHIRAFAALCAGATLCTLGLLFDADPWLWLLLRLGAGYCIAGTYLVMESWLAHFTTGTDRGRVLAIYIMTCQLGLAVGQALVGLWPASSPLPIVLGAALYVGALVPVVMTRGAQPTLVPATRLPFMRVLRIAPVGVVGALGAGMTTGALLVCAPLLAFGLGQPEQGTSTFMAVLVASGLLLQWPIGRLSDVVDRRLVIDALAAGIFLVSAVAMLHLEPSAPLWQLVLAGSLIGALAFVIYPVSLAHGQDLLPPEHHLALSGTLVLAYGLGAAGGPLLAGLLMEARGPLALFWWLAAVNGVLTVVSAVRLALRRRLPEHEAVTFAPVALPQATWASELDPRGETLQLEFDFAALPACEGAPDRDGVALAAADLT